MEIGREVAISYTISEDVAGFALHQRGGTPHPFHLPQAQGWTGKSKSGHCHRLAEVGIHPLAIGQDRPSRLGSAGEGRSDGGVLHLHPRGQARYPEGGRRREDEPPGKGGAFAPIQETTSTRATSTVPAACPMRWSAEGHNGYSRTTVQTPRPGLAHVGQVTEET